MRPFLRWAIERNSEGWGLGVKWLEFRMRRVKIMPIVRHSLTPPPPPKHALNFMVHK